MTEIVRNTNYLIMRDVLGENPAYLCNAHDTIKRLDRDTKANKWVWFTYKRRGPPDIDEVLIVERCPSARLPCRG